MGWSEGDHVDERRFDHVTRRFAARLTRRQAIGAGGSAMIGILSGRRAGAAYPHRRGPFTRCEEFTCAAAVISSSAHDAGAPVLVDDVTIAVNGQVVYQDKDALPSRQAIPVGAVAPGDKIHVQASDPVRDQAHQIGPLHLHCLDGEGRLLQTLDAAGVTGNSPVGQAVVPFYDREFTLACMH